MFCFSSSSMKYETRTAAILEPDFHVYNVIEKLGATNRTKALAVATRLGLIDIG